MGTDLSCSRIIFIISVGACRQIGVKKILQILNFHSFGNFIAFRHSDHPNNGCVSWDCLRLHVVGITLVKTIWRLAVQGWDRTPTGPLGVRALLSALPSWTWAFGLYVCGKTVVPHGITCAFQAAKIGQTKEKRYVPDEALFFEIVIVFPKAPPERQFSLVNQN